MRNFKTVFSVVVLVLLTLFGFSQTVFMDTTQLYVGGPIEYNLSQELSLDGTLLPQTDTVNYGNDTWVRQLEYNITFTTAYNGGIYNVDLQLNGMSDTSYSSNDTVMVERNSSNGEYVMRLVSGDILLYVNITKNVTDSTLVLSVFDYETVKMNMFPNPTTTNLNFLFNDYPNQVTYIIYNTSGQLVRQGELTNTLYVGDLTNGMYIINLNVDGVEVVKEFKKL